MIFVDKLDEAIEILKTWKPSEVKPIFYTAGTGIPDEQAIEYYKGTNVTIMIRDGSIWKNGEMVYEARIH